MIVVYCCSVYIVKPSHRGSHLMWISQVKSVGLWMVMMMMQIFCT